MVFKKPYAFIIKHFRIIHLLLLIPMVYLVIKSGNIVNFFNEYVANDYHLVSGSVAVSRLSATYVNIFMFLAIIVILGVYITITFLLQNKNKPTKYYNVSIVYYIFLFVMFTVCISILQMIEEDTLSNTFAHIIRDIAVVIRYSEFIFIGFNLVRGIGFNLRKFNFESDVADLEISAEDNEEFEFLVGKDTYKTKRNIRRFFRELGYYYQENKFVFTIIFIVIGLVLGNIVYTNINVYQKIYGVGDSVALGEINFVVNDAYLTTLDLNGNTLKNNKVYLVLQTKLINRYRDDKALNYENLQVVVNRKRISPNLMVGNSFLDMGNPFSGSVVKGNSEFSYVIVYELDEKDRANKYVIEAYSGYNPGGIGAITRTVSVKPEVINSKVTTTNVNMGTTVSFEKTHVGKTTLNLKSYEFYKRFQFMVNGINQAVYIDVVKDRGKTLMVMDYDLNLDQESDYEMTPKDMRTFFYDFMKIKYVVEGQTYYENVSVSNPINYDDKLIFKVNEEIEQAEEIEAIVTVRNISYVIKLK